MEEAAEVSAGGAVLQVELVLAQAVAAADGIDGHPDLHPIALREREDRPQRLCPERPLAGDRRLRLEAAEPPDRPAGEPEREAEAAADPPAEGRHREVALPSLHR